MKKIIVSLLIVLIGLVGFSQTPYPPFNPFGSKGTMTNTQGGWKIDSTAIMPVYVDTFAANRSKTSLYPGSLIRVGDDYYYRSADTSKWLLLAITTSNCAGTQLISGSITWSGSGLVYDATDLDYYILCSRYFANSTTLTLATADPTYGRIDKFYADNTQNIGVITGTPSANPQEPSVNPLTQIDLGFVYIPAGSTVPAGTTQTVIYNENVEWSGTSNVPSINFAYATNPYIGSVSTYLPSAPNSSYVEWQSGGIDYLFSDAQYLKFWVRLNANFVNDPLSFLDVTFEYTDVTVSQTLAIGNGDYNMDYSLINQWQLVSIPLTGITTYGTEFNSVHFVINSAPTSFQLDYVYLLETATVPPAPVGGTWLLNGNSAINDATQYIGTRDAKKLNFGTNGQIRAYIDTAGIDLLIDDTTANVILIDSNGKIWKTYQPTILADSPLVVYTDVYQDRIKADTTRRGAALATQYYADSVANAGGSGWSLTGNAGTDTSVNFFGTTDNRDIIIKRNNIRYGYYGVNSTGLGLYSLKYGNTGANNTSIGNYSMFNLTTGTQNTAVGFSSLSELTTGDYNVGIGQGANRTTTGTGNVGVGYASLSSLTIGSYNVAVGTGAGNNLTTGIKNTLIGDSASTATLSTDSSVAIGSKAVASTKQVAFSPHLTTMFLDLDSASGTAPAIAGIDENGNWRKYATPAGATLTNTYVGVGNGAGISGGPDLTFDGGILRTVGINMAGGDMDSVSNIFGGSYYGIWAGDPVGEVYGGTGQSAYTTGDLIYASATNTLSKLGIGTAAQSLKVVGGIPAWKDTLAVSGVYATLTGSETLTNKTITSPTLSGTLIGSGTIGGSTVINTAGTITGFNIVATGLIRSAASSNIEHNGRNKFNAASDGFETLTANSGAANTANLSVGSLRTNYVAKTANYTATAFDETISCSTNSFTITLPTAVGCAGQKYNITNSTAAQTITIGTTSSQTFANVTATPTTLSLVGLGAVIVVSDGANWLQLK